MSPRLLLVWLLLVLSFPAIAADIIGTPKVSVVAGNSAVVSWKTDVETGTRVRYGLAPDQLTERGEGGTTATHEVTSNRNRRDGNPTEQLQTSAR